VAGLAGKNLRPPLKNNERSLIYIKCGVENQLLTYIMMEALFLKVSSVDIA